MDIKELEDYRLSDAVKFNLRLNPKIWGPDEHLLPEVREKLLAIAADFKEFLGLDLEVTDITISGSNAAYTYTDHSDIDLHLVADLPKADVSEIYRELFDAKKYQYNDQHTFKIGGYDVELYVQNANEDPKSQGIYSVLDNKWISVPKRRKPKIDDISVKSKYEDLGKRIEAAIQSGDAAQLETLGKKVREFRQAGLDKTGEFGPENLAFKILRSNGTLDQLRAARLAAKDQELSIDEAKKKKKTRYGFGGYYFPGYHYYGQTDAADDGGGDGGESVKESSDSMDTQLQNFVKFCSDRLKLEQIPRIQIKRDPEWSRRNNSFGRYIPDADTLIVSVANRHPMDVMRTMAHELTHRKQDEQADMPIGAGDTGSDWENQANAQAGVLMRDFAELHPEYFGKEPISEGSGKSGYKEIEFVCANPKFPEATDPDLQKQMHLGLQQISGVIPLLQDQSEYSEGQCSLTAIYKDPSVRPQILKLAKQLGVQIDLEQPVSDNYVDRAIRGEHYGQQVVAEGKLTESVVFLNPDTVIVGQDHSKPLNLSPETLKRVQAIAAKHGAWYEGNGKDRTYTKGQIDKYVGSWDDEVAKTASPNDPKWLYVLFANVDENNRVQRIGVDAQDTIFNRLLATAKDNSFQNTGFTSQALQKFLSMASEGKYDFVKMSQQPATQENLTRFLKAGESLMWPSNWEQYPNKAGKIAKAATVDVRDQYLATRKAGVYVTGSGHLKAVQDITGQQVVAEASGYIPVNKKEAGDPRYSMALTVDIKPGENQRQAAKMGWKTNPAGTPPTARTNGLVEALTRRLEAVKEGLSFPLVSEQDLEEVAMSPGSLKAFAASDVGQSMMAGFEAELIFTGLGANEEEGEWENDYSYDPRAYSLNDIEEFFGAGDFAEGLSRRQRNELEEDWMEWYDQTLYDEFDAPVAVREWIQENDWDEEDLIERALDDEYSEDRVKEILAAMERRVKGTGTAADLELVEEYVSAEREVERQLDERVELAVEEHNSDYESALDEFRENWDRDESDWLRDRGWRNMSDLAYNFDFTWPHMTMTGGSSEGGFNEDAAQQLADDLADKLDVTTTVSTGYHSARRDASTWIFEPDGSLEADDDDNMPVEIVSPPMPLGKTLEILPKFFAWAKDNGAYANDSTGFHMSVSMPDHEGNFLDYTKLALFLGDEYVLKQFGREANTYAKSAISKIRDTMGKSLSEATETRADAVLSAMRKHLGHFASRAIAQPSGFGKYTSINPKTNYIEFRSAGGSDYFADMDKIQNTLMRYARAMDIAMDPDAEKAEYARKLYKLLTRTETEQVTDPKTGRTRTEVKGKADNDAISIFSRYVAGELPKSELKGFLKQLQYGREVAKNPPKEKIQWKVTHPNRRATITLMASSAEEAIKLAKQEYNDTMNPDDAYRAEPVAPATQTPATDQLNAPVPDDPRGNFVLRRREGNEGVGPILYRFSAGTTGDAINAARRWTEARGMERRSVYLDSIESLSPEELRATPPIETEPQNFPAAGNPEELEPQVAQNFTQTGGEFTGRWKIVSGATGEVLHTFTLRSTDQAAANRVARDWAQRTRFDDTVEVYPEMG